MISFNSISSAWAIFLRHIYLLKKDINSFLFELYWPILDILVWVFLGSWINQTHNQNYNYEALAMLGVILWQIVGRGCNVIVISLLEELWSGNIVNFFSLPLSIIQWIGGIILNYLFKISIVTIVSISMAVIFSDLKIWYMISTFLIFAPPLFFSAIWLGFSALSVIITLGRKGSQLGFIIVWFFLPFSGAYYPIQVLPNWGQTLSKFLPMSYVFNAMRNYVINQQDPRSDLIKAYLISISYAIFAIMLFIYSFNKSKQKGLARLLN